MLHFTKIILSLICLTIISCAGTDLTTAPFNAMCKISSKKYIDQTEVTVSSWLSYYTWTLEHEGELAANKLLPRKDGVSKFIWEYLNTKSEYESNYLAPHTQLKIGYFINTCDEIKTKDSLNMILDANFKRKGCQYLNFPITGITYDQAVSFCNWRTKINGSGNVIYRLPTESEWMEFAFMGLSDNEKANGLQDSLYKETKYQTFNYKCFPESGIANQIGQDSSFIKSRATFVGNMQNVFDLFGNVSEMIATEGISKGGHYNSYASHCKIDSVIEYKKPEKWLGFRCIAEIK